MKHYSRLRAVVDLDAVMYNIESMHANLRGGTQMIVVVKMDGYGHGAVPIAKMLEDAGYVWGYAVATFDEGTILRHAGIKKPILCLGCVFPEQFGEMIDKAIRMTVYDKEMAYLASEKACEMGKQAIFHIKVDTGMSRLGFLPGEASEEEIAQICRLPGVVPEGIFTHFAKADEEDKEPSQKALALLRQTVENLAQQGIRFPICHASNSAAIIDMPEANLDLVRAGIAVYGLYPSDEVGHKKVSLKPAMELIAHVTYVKWIEPGTQVSYGGTFTAPERMRIATVPVGYGDGYPRSLSRKGYVLIHGKKAPILGNVCMDQFMVDVTHIPETAFGDKVTLVGKDGDEVLTVEELSRLSGRFHYEFVCDINKRVPREYVRDGKIVAQSDYF
ncbi:MAG: alanine racemase [Coprococcus sp.]|nr:alanine racemase [Coprococcus sp.]